MKLRLAVGALALALCAPLHAATATEKLHRLFDEDWERILRDYPEYATFLGDARYNDRWTDLSLAAIEARDAADRVLTMTPNFTITGWLRHIQFERQLEADRLAQGLRKAGLPL